MNIVKLTSIIVVALVMGTPSLAAINQPLASLDQAAELYEGKGFIPLEHVDASVVPGFERAKAAVVNYRVKGALRFFMGRGQQSESDESVIVTPEFVQGECSGAYTSEDGHMFTALHCLRPCFENFEEVGFGKNHTIKLNDSLPNEGPFFKKDISDIFLVGLESEKNISKARCTLVIDGQDHNARVISIGAGLSSARSVTENIVKYFRHEKLQDLASFTEQGLMGGTDFVMLKVELPKKTPCVPVAKFDSDPSIPLPYAMGDLIYSINFPAATKRPNLLNSDGKQPYFSVGKTSSSFTDSTCLSESFGRFKVHQDPDSDLQIKKFFVDQSNFGHIYSNLETMSGSSGGPIFTKKGELLGVISTGNPMPSEECRLGSKFLALASFEKTILEQAKLQNEDDKVFNCPTK